MVTTRPPKTIVKPTALGPVANTDTKLLIYGLFQKGRVLAQDGVMILKNHIPATIQASLLLNPRLTHPRSFSMRSAVNVLFRPRLTLGFAAFRDRPTR